ncbi:unnamed protein product, partial [Thlaspi arvense]
MADPDDTPDSNADVSWQNRSIEVNTTENLPNRISSSAIDGRDLKKSTSTPTLSMSLHIHFDANSALFSTFRSVHAGIFFNIPDLVICAGSPDIPSGSYKESPRIFRGASIELSLENGINGPEVENQATPDAAKCQSTWQVEEGYNSPEVSLELLPASLIEEKFPEKSLPVVCINSGSLDEAAMLAGTNFLGDSFFSGGDTIRTDNEIGDGAEMNLYQTARLGNFSYNLNALERGNYLVDLYLAEIVFTNGPPGMRVFNVYLQEQEVVSDIDIYARVGANKPLVISDLKTFVSGDEGLSDWKPSCLWHSVKKDLSASIEEIGLLNATGMLQENRPSKDCKDTEVEGEFQKLLLGYECQKKELMETRGALEELRRENEFKSKECQEAWKSLKELQNELMRKSMHVGSLAFAVEGQVKEKSRWFSSLRDLKRKLKILKMDQIKLSEEALSYKKFVADMNDMSCIIQSKLNQQVQLHEDLKIKFIKGPRNGKNFTTSSWRNIRVFCRCRPLNAEEIAAGVLMAVDFEAAKDGELIVKSNGAPKKSFKFDAVFGPQSSQVDVFEDTAPFAASVLDGYNVCIFAYGQTGTGKTFTMEGTDEARGVNYRTLEELFRIIKERQGLFQYEVSVSVLEVYNEQIRDLLGSGTQPGVTAKRLEVKQVGEGIHHVPGLVEANVNNMSEVWEVLQTGSNARAVGSTHANEHSSRSHCIHCVMVEGENLLNGESTRSKLWLVDLAGSERELQAHPLASRLSRRGFKDVDISPNENDQSETLCSLNFASRVRGIELGPAKKQIDSSELLKYKQLVEKAKLDLKGKDVQLKKMEDTIHGLDVKMKEKDLKNKNLQDKKLARQHVESKLGEQQQLMRQLQEEQNSAVTRPPLATRPLGLNKNFNEGKEQVNHIRPLSENNTCKLPSTPPHNDPSEKENNPDIAEQIFIPKRTGRASLCPEHSHLFSSTACISDPLPLPTILAGKKEDTEGVEAKGFPEPTPLENSPKELKSGGKKLTSALRRSLQKRIQIRSPMPQHVRRGGVNVGMEKVRVSIGGRGRVAHRMLLGNARRAMKDVQQKQSQREKERGWNIGTAGKTVL